MGSMSNNFQSPSPIAFDVERPSPEFDHLSQLRRASEQNCTVSELVSRYLNVAAGYGRLSFKDFMRLRLFEPRFADRARLSAFVGDRRNLYLCEQVNYRVDWFGMLTDKVAEGSYLSAFGLPTIGFQAIYSPGCSHGPKNLGNAAELERFLLHEAQYPLFGKPVEGLQSLGSLGLRSCNPTRRALERFDGKEFPLDDLITAIVGNYPSGYVFQSFVVPSATIRALCGDRLSTIRFLTLQTSAGPVIARTAMKIPSGFNVADNFWRKGNLLAQIDPETGRLGRVVSGSGLEMIEVARHPETDMSFSAWIHPNWEGMRTLALDGATTMRHVPMIGWDIADTASGPTIVEMNVTPDMFLFQLADGVGMMDTQFRAFIEHQAQRGETHRKAIKAILQAI